MRASYRLLESHLFPKRLGKPPHLVDYSKSSSSVASPSSSENSSSLDPVDNNGYRLYLYNHYTRSKELVRASESIVSFNGTRSTAVLKPVVGTAYVCGPTVYDHCHIGHAMAYIRFDIFRRFLRAYSNVDLVTAMGVTDIDDKIISKANEEGSTYKAVGDQYFNSFLDDLQAMNISPADTFVRVTDHINEITDYIGQLEASGFAYINPETGDVNFDSSKLKDFNDQVANVTDKSKGKKSPKDFALWRAASEYPLWTYSSPVTGQKIDGRPGWHVECSVSASWIFGSKLDFHFGGKDLIYPHHFCESACSSAYFNLTDKQPATKWASHWVHSSHIKLAKEKMSKSLGNVITIKDFLKFNSPDILRIMCSYNHYRTDFVYDHLIVKRYNELDRRFKQFALYVRQRSIEMGLSQFTNRQLIQCQPDNNLLARSLQESSHEILSGAADDFNLHKGLTSILELIKLFDSMDNPTLTDLHCLKEHIFNWMDAIGLTYPHLGNKSTSDHLETKNDLVLIHLLNYRQSVRSASLKALKSKDLTIDQAREQLIAILKSSDDLREQIDSLGFVIKDIKHQAD